MAENLLANCRKERRYEASHIERVYKLALLGLSNNDLAVAFGVALSTLGNWIAERPEFKAALEDGRIAADTKVAAALYKRALGYDKKVTKLATAEGKFTDKEEILEHVPADVGAAQFWLKNRQKQYWTDRSELEMVGDTGIVVKFDIPRPSIRDLQLERDADVGKLPRAGRELKDGG